MILPFSTQLNGIPTFFVEKILYGLFDHHLISLKDWAFYTKDFSNDAYKVKEKYHSFREDKNDRWKPGVMIDFFINTRTKDMFRFAPRIPVVSTQEVKIIYKTAKIEIYIDDKLYSRYCLREKKEDYKLLILANNDGFDGMKIIDTHLGGGSNRISADKFGFEFVASEIDNEYFEKQEKRFSDYKKTPFLPFT